MKIQDSKFWKSHAQKMKDGRRTNAYYEYIARKAFERFCNKAGFTPYMFIEFESLATFRKKAQLGRAVYNEGNKLVSIAMEPLRQLKDPVKEIEETVAHELAHMLFPGNKHRDKWKAQMVRWGYMEDETGELGKRALIPKFARTKVPPVKPAPEPYPEPVVKAEKKLTDERLRLIVALLDNDRNAFRPGTPMYDKVKSVFMRLTTRTLGILHSYMVLGKQYPRVQSSEFLSDPNQRKSRISSNDAFTRTR